MDVFLTHRATLTISLGEELDEVDTNVTDLGSWMRFARRLLEARIQALEVHAKNQRDEQEARILFLEDQLENRMDIITKTICLVEQVGGRIFEGRMIIDLP
jgi:hypothetical protein